MDPPGEIIWLAAVHPHRYQSTSLNLWRSIGNIKFYYFSWGQLHLRVTWGEHFLVAPDSQHSASSYSGSDHFSRHNILFQFVVVRPPAGGLTFRETREQKAECWYLAAGRCSALHCLLFYHCTWLHPPVQYLSWFAANFHQRPGAASALPGQVCVSPPLPSRQCFLRTRQSFVNFR